MSSYWLNNVRCDKYLASYTLLQGLKRVAEKYPWLEATTREYSAGWKILSVCSDEL
jgi:hypothetical protein